jgi:hypothetical protein
VLEEEPRDIPFVAEVDARGPSVHRLAAEPDRDDVVTLRDCVLRDLRAEIAGRAGDEQLQPSDGDSEDATW